MGWSSTPCSRLSKLRSQSSNLVSSEKSASTAPALVPVTTKGISAPGDQAKAAVLGISRNRTILLMCCSEIQCSLKECSHLFYRKKRQCEGGILNVKDTQLERKMRSPGGRESMTILAAFQVGWTDLKFNIPTPHGCCLHVTRLRENHKT
jgi:hypothetical protein